MEKIIHLVDEGHMIWNATANVYVMVSASNIVYTPDGAYMAKTNYEKMKDTGRLSSRRIL